MRKYTSPKALFTVIESNDVITNSTLTANGDSGGYDAFSFNDLVKDDLKIN